MDRITSAANALFDMRQTRRVVPALPADAVPQSMAEGYRAQAVLVEKLLARDGGHAIGYKIAATNPVAQQALAVDAPFYGVLMTNRTQRSPGTLRAADFTVRCTEGEFGFEMGADVPASDTPYTAETISPFIAAVIPSIEIVDHRFQDWKTVGAPSLAADNAIHGAWIEGSPARNWRGIDLARHPVTLFVNGTTFSVGGGANVLGNPLNVVAWLANELPRHGKQLRRGDKISTGTAHDVYLAQPGDRVVADFGSLGRVELTFEE